MRQAHSLNFRDLRVGIGKDVLRSALRVVDCALHVRRARGKDGVVGVCLGACECLAVLCVHLHPVVALCNWVAVVTLRLEPREDVGHRLLLHPRHSCAELRCRRRSDKLPDERVKVPERQHILADLVKSGLELLRRDATVSRTVGQRRNIPLGKLPLGKQ